LRRFFYPRGTRAFSGAADNLDCSFARLFHRTTLAQYDQSRPVWGEVEPPNPPNCDFTVLAAIAAIVAAFRLDMFPNDFLASESKFVSPQRMLPPLSKRFLMIE
jgi:hypothetical protein